MTALAKSEPKSVRPGLRPFLPGPDARRGRGAAKGGPNAGRTPDEFRALMRRLTSRADVLDNLSRILTDKDPPHFLPAWQETADRGFGKAAQHLDVTSGHDTLRSFTLGLGTA